MVISYDAVILHILLITPLITLLLVYKDLITPYDWNTSDNGPIP